ncbi:ammonium transporter 2 [Quercus suber]|uniref:Ammonium transporter 2 n=1 Tax=Quercus suber TaxID=58331 RepID=A0AAW0IVB0_QUESU
MGIMSGSITWYTMMVLHKRIGFLKQVDDTMAVFHTHAVAGSLGGILAGWFHLDCLRKSCKLGMMQFMERKPMHCEVMGRRRGLRILSLTKPMATISLQKVKFKWLDLPSALLV